MLFNGVCSCVHSEPAMVAGCKNCKGKAITVASGSMGIGLSLPYHSDIMNFSRVPACVITRPSTKIKSLK